MMNCTTSRMHATADSRALGDSPIKGYDDNYSNGKPIPVSGDNYHWELRFRANQTKTQVISDA